MKHFISICSLIFFCSTISSYAQVHPNIREILNQLGSTARAYLLTANRPSYSFDAYTADKNSLETDISVSYSKDVSEIPLSLNYGISDNFQVETGIDLFTQSYNFSGQKMSGVGDANLGFGYKFQESEYFSHAFHFLIKIPTASSQTQLGTGLVDWHLCLAQGFNYKNFGYDMSLELGFLNRRKFPFETNGKQINFGEKIDSIIKKYNYRYEPELVFSLSPSVNVSDNMLFYTGLAFSRNFKLNFNTLQISAGLGYQFSNNFALSIGASYGLVNTPGFIFSTGVTFIV